MKYTFQFNIEYDLWYNGNMNLLNVYHIDIF